MGTRGPIPKRSTERRRRNLDGRTEKITAAGVVVVPACPDGAHAIAANWYEALRESGQAQYFEPSDWAAALLLVEQLTRVLKDTGPISGPTFASIWGAMGELGTTEGARRRMRVEIERAKGGEEEAPPGVTAIEEFRRRAGK